MRSAMDSKITCCAPLPSAAALLRELPLSPRAAALVKRSRAEVRAILDRSDDRLLVVLGPCAAHHPGAVLDYASRLAAVGPRRDLLIVMRVHPDQARAAGPARTDGEAGRHGPGEVGPGLSTGRRLLLDLIQLGLQVGCEWQEPVTAHYLADAVSWSEIGAGTTESQVHRQFVSGLSMPVGFRNGTDGDVQVAVDGCRAAAVGHTFFALAPNGSVAVAVSSGNPDCHVILRGGRSGPNYQPEYVTKALDLIADAGLPRRAMVDASQGGGPDHRDQSQIAAVLAEQVAAGEAGLTGVVLQSCPREDTVGNCLDFDATTAVLETLAAAVRQRRTSLRACRSRLH